MNLKTRKEKFINNLKQDKFKNELASPEYACYSEEQKRDIMKAIKGTRWDLPYIRDIFQNAKVQQNIDCLLYLFKASSTKDQQLSFFSWNLICELLSHLDENLDFNLAVGLLEDFSHSNMEKTSSKTHSLSATLLYINNKPFLTAKDKREYFNCVLQSSNQNYEIGEMVSYLYNLCCNASTRFNENAFDSAKYFEIVKESYKGFLDARPDLYELIKENYEKFNSSLHYLEFSTWDTEDFESLINLLNILNKELLDYKENVDTIKGNSVTNINK